MKNVSKEKKRLIKITNTAYMTLPLFFQTSWTAIELLTKIQMWGLNLLWKSKLHIVRPCDLDCRLCDTCQSSVKEVMFGFFSLCNKCDN